MPVKYFKRIIVSLLTSALLIQFVAAAPENYVSESTKTYKQNTAISLVSYLVPSFECAESEVTRADFVKYAITAFKADFKAGAECGFSDVSAESDAYNAICNAVSLGWISKDENFNPDNPIKYEEALKIAVHACGYEFAAKEEGGYPAGYVKIAQRLSLFSGTANKDTISPVDAAVIIYNMLKSNMTERIINGNSAIYRERDINYLYGLHELYERRGTVTATEFTSVSSVSEPVHEGQLQIDGVNYSFDGEADELIGRECTIFYRSHGENDLEIAALSVREPSEKIIVADDYDGIDSENVYYYENGKRKSENYNSLIFNGKVSSDPESAMKTFTNGEIRLLDTDNDGNFELAVVDSYYYMLTDNVNFVEKTIGDSRNSENPIINVDDEKTKVIFSAADETDGEEYGFSDIANGTLLAVMKSEDGKLIRIIVCANGIGGKIDYVDLEYSEISIDGTAYKMADYLKNHYKEYLVAGTQGYFYIGVDGKVAAFNGSRGMYTYGYAVWCRQKNDVDGKLYVKIFSEKGTFETLQLCDKLTVDGVSGVSSADTKAVIDSEPQLFRFKTNTKGEINGIDFSRNNDDDYFERNYPENDCLTFFPLHASSMLYKSQASSFAPYFNVVKSLVFKVPYDLEDDDNFAISDKSTFVNDQRYNETQLYVYDIGKDGCASAVVYRYDPKNRDYNQSDKSYIVESVSRVLKDDEETKLIKCWADGAYYELYLGDDVAVKKDSGSGLCPGDIFRAVINSNNEIMALSLDIDAYSGTPAQNSKSSAVYFGQNITVTYYLGKVYSLENGYAYISNTKNIFDSYDYGYSSLLNCNLGAYIIKFNSTTKTLKPISSDEIRSYRNYADDNSMVVLRQHASKGFCVYVYE